MKQQITKQGSRVIAIAASFMALAGCSLPLYEVRDLDNGKVYETTSYQRQWLGGGIEFIDLYSGEGVVLQEYAVKQTGRIDSEEVKTHTNLWTGNTTHTYK